MYDCGCFTIAGADFLSDNLNFEAEFDQSKVPFLRRKILADIIRGELIYRDY